MKKDTLFSRVYEDLKMRIMNGQLPSGGIFPSIQTLREDYQIGFRTARNVTRQLREEGFVKIYPRKAPIVNPLSPPLIEVDFAQEILAQKDSVLEVYKTITHIIPPLLSFSSQGCNLKDLPHYTQALKIIHRGIKPDEWRVLFLLCQEIVQFNGNPLATDLYASLTRFSCLSFFFKEQRTPICALLSDAKHFITILELYDPHEKHRQLTVLCQRIFNAVKECMEQLKEQYPEPLLSQKCIFQWNLFHGRNYCYTDIMLDLIPKITSGFYPPGSYLPHEAALAKQYGVSISTLRKALSELRNLGYCKTLNAKGTIALKRDTNYAIKTVRNPAYRKEAILYLHAIQLMSLVIRDVARSSAPYFTQADVYNLTEKMKDPKANLLESIIHIITLRSPLEPLRIIIAETNRMISWSYYFSFYSNVERSLQSLRYRGQKACQALINNESEKFARELYIFYCQMFDAVRDYLANCCHLKEALTIRSPLDAKTIHTF